MNITSLSREGYKLDAAFYMDAHIIGAQHVTHPKMDSACVILFEYHGQAMTPRAPIIASHGARTRSVGSKNALMATNVKADEPSKQSNKHRTTQVVLDIRKKGTIYTTWNDQMASIFMTKWMLQDCLLVSDN